MFNPLNGYKKQSERLGVLLKLYREKNKLSQNVIAERCHVSQATISNIEKGVGGQDFFVILTYAESVGIEDLNILKT